jgi:flagellar motor protein MotB
VFRIPRILAVAVLAASFAGCVSQEQYRRALADAANVRTQRDQLQSYLDQLETQNGDLRARLAELQGVVGDADWVREQRRKIEELLKGGTLPPNVEVDETPEGVVFRIAGEVLFASGQAQLTTDGQSTLRQLMPTLAAQDRRLRVEGHTDSDPIQRSSWDSNLRLSVERSMAVVEFLKSAGFPEPRLSVAGYGEFTPKAPNDSPEGKRRNRRVEILVRNDG